VRPRFLCAFVPNLLVGFAGLVACGPLCGPRSAAGHRCGAALLVKPARPRSKRDRDRRVPRSGWLDSRTSPSATVSITRSRRAGRPSELTKVRTPSSSAVVRTCRAPTASAEVQRRTTSEIHKHADDLGNYPLDRPGPDKPTALYPSIFGKCVHLELADITHREHICARDRR